MVDGTYFASLLATIRYFGVSQLDLPNHRFGEQLMVRSLVRVETIGLHCVVRVYFLHRPLYADQRGFVQQVHLGVKVARKDLVCLSLIA